ncbi:excalibur calcium-binding domain-containing protein [Paenibacillus xylaniclasticus]|uniref:excalibur calcium-binding domain-containing protein n=1 Tax=Paenibacillus xylaniclasticus TaxID=588083 RepID=UPI001FE80AB9|nr:MULTISPECIES: excalibur calcium-binding domain-containing protein [Paenibacillus]
MFVIDGTSGTVTPNPTTPTNPSTVYYKSCEAAKAAGAAPLYKGQPGYSTALDRDKDGVACEN